MAKNNLKTKTTRNTELNHYITESELGNVINSVSSYTADKNHKNIQLLDSTDSVNVQGIEIINDAAKNTTLLELGYNAAVVKYHIDEATGKLVYDLDGDGDYQLAGVNKNNEYFIFGAPHKEVLNNRQHFNNCGVESSLNTLATSGKITMQENLKDQDSVEKGFLQAVWERNLCDDDGEIGVLDEQDGGTLPDEYKEIFAYYDIDSEAYFISNKCDGYQYGAGDAGLKDLGYQISQGHGAVVAVCSKFLWQETESESGKIAIDHAVTLTGVVYDTPEPTANTMPVGFYIHDTGAWMTRFISLDEFREATLYDYHGDENDPDTEHYLPTLTRKDPHTGEEIIKQPGGGLFITITKAPIKDATFDLNATGDKNDNNIFGNSHDNILSGMAGNDFISGAAGDDNINGGTGNDELYGGAGDDLIYGENGNDIIVGNNATYLDKVFFQNIVADSVGDEKAVEAIGNIYTSEESLNGINTLYGAAGNDIIMGGNNSDLIYGGTGNDYIYGGDGRNAIYGEAGNDVLIGGYDNDRLMGDKGNDYLFGLDDEDVLDGGDGNDHLWGGRGNDRIETGAGNDVVYIEGKEYGIDEISSKSGTTTIQFVEELGDDGANFADITFDLSLTDEKKGMYALVATTDDVDEEDVIKNVVQFDDFFDAAKGKSKTLYVTDDDEITFQISASKSTKATVANTKTTGVNAGMNNMLFSTNTTTTKITTSKKSDVVRMVGVDSETDKSYETRIDKITYIGGRDVYISEEGNTYYTVKKFDSESTDLHIYDNVEGLTRIEYLPDHFGPVEVKDIVSTDDRMYINSKKEDLKFFFDVGFDGNGAVTTDNTELFVLGADDEDVDKYVALASEDSSDVTGYIYMDSFFGNGRIENWYFGGSTKNKDAEFDSNLAQIAENVAEWLSNSTYDTAFEVFNDPNASDATLSSLIAAYSYEAA